jgi:hypothetical protein
MTASPTINFPLELSRREKRLRQWSTLFDTGDKMPSTEHEELRGLLTTYGLLIDKVAALITLNQPEILAEHWQRLLETERNLTTAFESRRLATSPKGTKVATCLSHRE